MSITAKIYELNQNPEMVEITNISESDAMFFNDNNFVVSVEELPIGSIAVYSTIGVKGSDGSDIELTYIVKDGEQSEESFSNFRNIIESYLEKNTSHPVKVESQPCDIPDDNLDFLDDV